MKWRGKANTKKADLNVLRQEALEVLNTWGITSDDALFEFDLILCELIANAAEHGNQDASDRKVQINMRFLSEKNLMLIFIKDEGGLPFQINREINPCKKNLSVRGRGLVLLESMTDRCHLGSGRVWVRKETPNG